MSAELTLERLNRLLGTWTTEATHPARPGLIVHGIVVIEWLEGQRFLILRARTDEPEFPDSISIMGFLDRDRVERGPSGDPAEVEPLLGMHYFDSRGVFRVLEANIDDTAWRLRRYAPGFSQRFMGTFADHGETIDGRWQLCHDDVNWRDDLQITYRRRR